MDFTTEKGKKLAKWLIGIVTACILIFLGVQNIGVIASAISWIGGLFAPLLLGIAFAIVINVPMRFFEGVLWSKTKKKFLQKLRRPISYIISLIIIVGIIAGIVMLVIPELVSAVKVIVQSVTRFVNQLSAMEPSELNDLPFGSFLLNADWSKLLDPLQNWLKDQGGNIMNTAFVTISTLVGGVVDLFISIVFSVYVLFSKEKLKQQAARLIKVWLPRKFSTWFIHASSLLGTNFRNFIMGQSLEAVILGVLCMIGMLIFQIPYAPMVGALVGVTALIPIVGGLFGAVVGAFMILTVSPVKAIIFIVFLLVLQQLEGNLIYPKVMGSRVNLPAMWILAAVTVGGGIGGPLGMLLSVPLASTAYVLAKEATIKKEQTAKEPND